MEEPKNLTTETAISEKDMGSSCGKAKKEVKINIKTLLPFFLLVLVLAAAGAGTCLYIEYAGQWVCTNNAFVDGRIYSISSLVPGIIEKIHVPENTLVKKGAPLVSIDPILQDISIRNIFSPADGYAAHIQALEGEYALPGQTLMSIVNLDDLWITANFSEEQVRYIRVGQEVDIYIDAYPDKPLRGKVQSIMPASGSVFALFPPEATAGNWVRVSQRIPVKIIFKKDKEMENLRLRIGMLARVRVEK